jgi:sugar lactone lactonase YvrE
MFLSRILATALGIFSCASAAAQTYSWRAFAGLPPQSGVTDGTAANSKFNTPLNLIADGSGNIYVADSFNHTIRLISNTGNVSTFAGLPGTSGSTDGTATNARFFFPTGLALTRGALFVIDRGNHVIRRVTGTGEVTLYAGGVGLRGFANGSQFDARFDQPASMVADTAQNLYVADSYNHVIRRITVEGVVSTFAGSPGIPGSNDGTGSAAQFRFPESISIDAAGVLYVADRGNHTIRKISPAGAVSTLAGVAGSSGAVNGAGTAARFSSPSGVLAYGDGTLIVSDTGNNSLRLVTPAGVVSVLAGRLSVEGYTNGAPSAARFFEPSGLTFTSTGIMVADSLNHSIRKLDLVTYETSLLAGAGGNFGSVDGVGAAALFNYPNGVAVHNSGDVYVADTRGSSIRRISPAGAVTRVAGMASSDTYRDGAAGVASLNYPFGLTVTADRTIYFCENQLHTIRRVLPDGSVETIAGTVGVAGSTDGAGTTARFNFPSSIVRDLDGNIYISDTSNHTIRRIAAGTQVVTTFAGAALVPGSTDGVGSAARFRFPRGLAVDAQGNVYVADSSNHTVRKITRDGIVSTVAGTAGLTGSTDGAASVARFQFPFGIAVDAAGQIFVADTFNATIRVIKNDTVSTLGGTVGLQTFAEGTGTAARFFNPTAIAVDSTGTLLVSQSGSNLVAKGDPLVSPVIGSQPQAITTTAGGSATFSINAGGASLSYQWRFNGDPIPGATSATYTISSATAAMAGNYSVTLSNSFGTLQSQSATLTVVPVSNLGRITNLSILSAVDAPGDTFTMGFVVGGSGTTGAKPLVIRAAGPALTQLGVTGVLADPQFELFSGPVSTGGNDNWGGASTLVDAMKNVGAFDFPLSDSRDAAVVAQFESGVNSSVRVSGVGTSTGVVIAEIYDATPNNSFTSATPRLLNVSVLKHIGAGLTAGFTLGGATSKSILIRAIGPTLTEFGVTGVVEDPEIEVVRLLPSGGSTPVGSNDNWGGSAVLATAFKSAGAFPLPPTSTDAAIAVSLVPGSYTVRVTGKANTTGIAIVEIYELP